MTKVVADISVSVDGFVTGPSPGPDRGLGVGGEALHTWAVDSDDPVDALVLREATEQTGAVVMGRRLFDIVDGPHGWTDEMGYGARHAASPPFFVVTHAAPTSVRLDLDLSFVGEGVEAAVASAREAAAARGGDAVIMGGGSVVAQALGAGVVDLLRLHLAPVVLGAGTPLFAGGVPRPLVQEEVRVSSSATHVTYAVGG